MRFILVVTTISRTGELNRLLESLCRQTYREFEIIVVDQNLDDRVAGVVAPFSDRIPITRVRSRVGASNGRNRGLEFRDRADVIAFPDDDCWFAPDLLERVARLFAGHREWSGINGRSIAPDGSPSNGRWHFEPGPVTVANAWNRATMFTMFFRTAAVGRARFDDSLGGGANTRWGGGEDLDFLLQVIRDGHCVYYDPSLTVYHPEWSTTGYTAALYEKAASYARGMGRVLRKHHYSPVLVAYHLVRPLGGALIALATGNYAKATYHWSIFEGRWQGWRSNGTSDIRTLRDSRPDRCVEGDG